MPIAEIAGGIILALVLLAFWRVLLPFVGTVLVLAAAVSYGYMAASHPGGVPDAAPVAAAETAQSAPGGGRITSPDGKASERPAEGTN